MVTLVAAVVIQYINRHEATVNMFEATTHSFVIKIWLEETREESSPAVWRGRITHVPSGERKFIKDLQEISAFISPYLHELGAANEPDGRSDSV